MQRKGKVKPRRFADCLGSISKEARLVLYIGLPVVTAVLFRLFYDMVEIYRSDPIYVRLVYPAMFEYIMMSLLLIIGGAVILDIADKRQY